MTTWQQEAVGIEPWYSATTTMGESFVEFEEERTHAVTGERYIHRVERVITVPDLEDPDTLAAFDRRLALRLGAPEEAVREGVMVEVFVRKTWHLHMVAGVPCSWAEEGVSWPQEGVSWPWEAMVDVGDVSNTLLARVRAWKSVH